MRMAMEMTYLGNRQLSLSLGRATSPSHSTQLLPYLSSDLPDFPSKHHPRG